MSEGDLALAQAGDARAFRDLTDPYRREIQLHCYRLLGSLTDAEDLLQETLLAAWRGLDRFEGRASIRTWLYRIATNRCLNARRNRQRRPPPAPVPPFEPPEPTRHRETTWLQPYPDALLDGLDTSPGPEARYQAKEAIELAFIDGLQRLPPRQAATLVLRDVLGYPAAAVADMLATSETAVKGLLQRARASLGARHAPAHGSRPANPMPTHRTPGEANLVRRFADAYEAGDIDTVVNLLTDEAWLAMPPAPHEYHGRIAIAAFLRISMAWRGHRHLHLVPTGANTQPAFGCFLDSVDGATGEPAGLVVLTLENDGIGAVTRFLDNHLLSRFGPPA